MHMAAGIIIKSIDRSVLTAKTKGSYMQYLVSFLEGIITFISPCLLPMLPIYIAYFAGGEQTAQSEADSAQNGKPKNSSRALVNSLGFVLGFSAVFVLLGAFAGTVGTVLREHETAVNIVSGAIVIVFGLNYIGVLKIGFLNASVRLNSSVRPLGFGSAAVFGAVFAVGWTPCVGAFLGSALLLASQQGTAARGMLMLLVYSLGLGIPFVLSALLIDRLKGTFAFIKKNYRSVNVVCGALLIVVGILMMTGRLGALLNSITL